MKERIRQLVNTKSFHIVMIIVIITVILCALGIMLLQYQVEGETNMPFNIEKITIISSSESTDKDSGTNRWAFDINQNNDIYIYLRKNENYKEKEAIKSIIIDDFKVERTKELGTVNFYGPNKSPDGGNFANTQENLIQKIEYKGAMESDIKSLKIANQGGIVVFRYANDKVSEYVSNDEIINHSELLKKANVKEEDLKANLSFNLMIQTESGKEYKANIPLDMPVTGVVEKGTSSIEITDLDNIVFKRTKN